MKKTYIVGTLIVVMCIVLLILYKTNPSGYGQAAVGAASAKDATYVIDGTSVKLLNGTASVEVTPGSASKVVTQYFGNEVNHDFDNDGRQDVAFVLTQNTGGSGTFYYAVAALNTVNGYVGSDAVLLGDRIAPQSTNMGTGNVVVFNYADRKAGESFAVAPSVGTSKWLLLDTKTMKWGEVAQNFEGEADPSVMSLGMKKWNWISTTYSDGKKVTPKIPSQFLITFNSNKTFSAKTDCNSVAGEYTVSGKKIVFTKMLNTLMYCQNSQEQDFTKMLGQVESYMFTSKGELVLGLKLDSGSMVLK